MGSTEAPADTDTDATGITVEMDREAPCPIWDIEGSSCSPPVRSVGEGEQLVIGSAKNADVRVFDRAVSGRHCSVMVRGGELTVRDLGSKNGIYVGGARIESARLGPGSSFVLGRLVVTCSQRSRSTVAEEVDTPALSNIIGTSLAMRRVIRDVVRLADLRGPVLFRGETGTGKDVLARAMHGLGCRRGRPFVPLNVGTLPRELADAELFGHERGAYTGAHASRDGAFVEAHRGTLFLDEIAELAPDLQVKLLRVLEDGEVRPLGGRARRTVDVRVVAATWAPLHGRVAEGLFRQDLYQRLAVFVIDVPPLRERRTDLPLLASRFLEELESEIGARELSSAALGKLTSYAWPGNVRELRNVLYRAALKTSGPLIGSAEIAQSLEVGSAPQRVSVSPQQARALVANLGGNVSAAARQLGLARSTFRDLLQQ